MAPSSQQTYYEVLGLTQQAQSKEIRDAYRKLALTCHPDKNPLDSRAVAAFQKLGTAYETLCDPDCRRKYDATLLSGGMAERSPQPANWPSQTSSNTNNTTRMWHESMRSRAWDWSSRAKERADQARREDDEYWSGPTYFHGRTNRNAWGPEWDPTQSDRDKFEHHERQRAARKKARREADREQFEKEWQAEILLTLSKIISIQVDIEKARLQADELRMAAKDERRDEDPEHIFELPIKQKALERRLKECLHKYKRVVRLLRDRGREEDANEAEGKLREVRKQAARNERAGRKETEGTKSATETQTKGKAERDQMQPSTSFLLDQNLTARQGLSRWSGKCNNPEQPLKTWLPMYDGQSDEDTNSQQQPSCEYTFDPRASYDGSDPDRGFTEDTPEPSVAGQYSDHDDEDYDPPFCNDFHHSHMEVHKDFWDIIDSEHECNFCRKVCTVMQCPSCDVQACTYCKDTYG